MRKFPHKTNVVRLFQSILLLLVLLPLAGNSQSFYAVRRERSLVLVAGTGSSTYLGELNDKTIPVDSKPVFSVGVQKRLFNHFSLRGEAEWFVLSGDDAKGGKSIRTRNLSFRSYSWEASVIGVFDFLPTGKRFYQRPMFNIYAFGGLGYMHFNPKTLYQGNWVDLQPLQTELKAYSLYSLVIPMGLGARLKMGPFANITFEAGWRKTFTDYIDDVSTVHHDAAMFSNPLAATLSDRRPEIGLPVQPDGAKRGNPKSMDAYILYTVKLEYYLPDNLFGGGSSGPRKLNNTRRKSFYRYNKSGGLRRR